MPKSDPTQEENQFGCYIYSNSAIADERLKKLQEELKKAEDKEKRKTLKNDFVNFIHNLDKIEPKQSKTENGITSTLYGEENLGVVMTKNSEGLLDFENKGSFTGIVTIQRKDEQGNLITDSHDVIAYDNGKVVAFIEGEKGETRLAAIDKFKRSLRNEQQLNDNLADHSKIDQQKPNTQSDVSSLQTQTNNTSPIENNTNTNT